MFRLSRRKGSSLWQVRKRWPSDVAAILPGEFTKSTGEADRKKAQAMLPLIASEYEARVQQARDRLADSRFRDLAEPEIARLTAHFYRTALPAYRINRALSPAEAKATLAEVQGRVASLEAAQARQDYWAVESAANTLIVQQGLPIPEESPSRDTLKSMLHLAFTELHRGIAQQLQGEEQAAPSDPRLARALEIKADAADHTVNALIKAYKKAKWEDWSASSREAVEAPFRALKDILGDRDISSVTREDARGVVAMLRDLPAGMGRHAALKGLSVPQAIEAGKRLEIEPIKPATINRAYLAHIAALFKWAMKEGWITSTPFTGLAVKDSVAEIDKRDPFTAPQLQTLFTSDTWIAPAKPDIARPGRFWVPLVALFTGARLGEIAGLRIADVEEVDGLTALRIRAHAGRSLKTSYSRRDLPLHPELVRLGFAAFLKHRCKVAKPEELLFPDAKANVRGQAGAKLGEWFVKTVKGLGLTGTKLGMHSFRHGVEDRLIAADLYGTALGRALLGRESGGSEKSYGKGFTVKDFARALERITYPDFDLSHLYAAND